MNKIFFGQIPVELPKRRFLFIHDEVPDLPYARVFDPTKHSFNPLQNLDYRKASGIVDIFDTLFSRGDSTLTKDTGLDFIADALETSTSLDTLIDRPERGATTGQIWAYGKVRRLLRSPVLKQVFCSTPNFSFSANSVILARINRAELGDFDALALGLFLIRHYQGRVVVPDFGFYGRDSHVSLIRENRLIAGVRLLDELPAKLRQNVLLVDQKDMAGVLYTDAEELARHAGLLRGTVEFNDFVAGAMQQSE
jgi:hypothetical protein